MVVYIYSDDPAPETNTTRVSTFFFTRLMYTLNYTPRVAVLVDSRPWHARTFHHAAIYPKRKSEESPIFKHQPFPPPSPLSISALLNCSLSIMASMMWSAPPAMASVLLRRRGFRTQGFKCFCARGGGKGERGRKNTKRGSGFCDLCQSNSQRVARGRGQKSDRPGERGKG